MVKAKKNRTGLTLKMAETFSQTKVFILEENVHLIENSLVNIICRDVLITTSTKLYELFSDERFYSSSCSHS